MNEPANDQIHPQPYSLRLVSDEICKFLAFNLQSSQSRGALFMEPCENVSPNVALGERCDVEASRLILEEFLVQPSWAGRTADFNVTCRRQE